MGRHVHILGIAGTFMSSLAILARELGFTVTGCDAHCYPPVSDMLSEKHIDWHEGYALTDHAKEADYVIVGNVAKRGMPVVEYLLNSKRPLWSGPQWLATHVLPDYQVVTISGTHGKTSTTAILTHILELAEQQPGFLIGGVDNNLNTSARLGQGRWFVIEADEYDSAFFDKRPKMMHYRPDIAIINNLEFDHGDIYRDLAAIQQQFHYYLRCIPGESLLITPAHDGAINQVLSQGLYCRHMTTGIGDDADYHARLLDQAGNCFNVSNREHLLMDVSWPVIGEFNVKNALMAIAAALNIGVDSDTIARALSSFKTVKRRLQKLATVRQIDIYDDFAHHPTAIENTISALKKAYPHRPVTAIVELGSNTMRQGGHDQALPKAVSQADLSYFWGTEAGRHGGIEVINDGNLLVDQLMQSAKACDIIVFMSNRGFNGLQNQLIDSLNQV